MFSSVIKNLKNDFLKDTAALSGSAAIAQLIALAVFPLLTRIYSIEDFGILALYVAIFTYLRQLATVSFEQIIVLPEADHDARAVFAGLFVLALVVSTLIALVVVLFGHAITSHWLYEPKFEKLLLVLPVAVFTMSCYIGLRYLLIRERKFISIGIAFVSGTVIGSLTSVVMGLYLPEYYKVGGLIIGHAIQAVVFLYLVARSANEKIFDRALFRLSTIQRAVAPFKTLVLSITLSNGLAITYSKAPVFFVSFLFGNATLGLYAMAERIASAPRMLIANAIGDVYRQRAAAKFNSHGRFDDVFVRILITMLAIAAPIYCVAILFAEEIFAVVLGESWRVAGHYASIILVGGLFAFVGSPLDKSPMIRHKHGYLIGWPIGRILLKAIVFIYAYVSGASIETVLWLLVATRILSYSVGLGCEYIWARGWDVRPTARRAWLERSLNRRPTPDAT